MLPSVGLMCCLQRHLLAMDLSLSTPPVRPVPMTLQQFAQMPDRNQHVAFHVWWWGDLPVGWTRFEIVSEQDDDGLFTLLMYEEPKECVRVARPDDPVIVYHENDWN